MTRQRDDLVRPLLAEADTLLAGLIDNALIGVYVIQDKRFSFVNNRLAQLFGYSQEELCAGMGPLDLTAPDDRQAAQEEIDRQISGTSNSGILALRGMRKDGTPFDVEVFGAAARLRGEPAIIGMLADVSERRAAERAADDRLHFIGQLLDAIPSPVFCKDAAGRYSGCNTAFEKYIGLDRQVLIGRTVFEIAPSDLAERYWAADRALFDHPGTQTYEAVVAYADGSRHDVVFNKATFDKPDGSLGGLVGVILDITERKAAERKVQEQVETLSRINRTLKELNDQLRRTQTQLVQSEKMAAIGLLAAGMAHEINNPISAAHSNVSSLGHYFQGILALLKAYEEIEAELPEGRRAALRRLREEIDLNYLKNDIPDLIRESRESIIRVRKIIDDLIQFSHGETREETWQWFDLHAGIDSIVNIVRSQIGERTEIVREYGDLPEIQCLPTRINQAILSLLINAAQAIGADKGTITIRTGRQDDAVWLEIADDGCGIAEEVQGKIFDPFFTTRPVGQGTGLGLSVALGVARMHRGTIDVDSAVGKGSRFRLTLPIGHSEAAAPAN